MGQWLNGTIVLLSNGPIFILIDRESTAQHGDLLEIHNQG